MTQIWLQCEMTWNEQVWRPLSPSLRHSIPGKGSAVGKEKAADRFRGLLEVETKYLVIVLTCW